MDRVSGRVLAGLLALASAPAAMGQGTITDQAVSLVYLNGHWSGTPLASLLGATPSGDPLYQSGWWYRLDGDTHEWPLPPPDTQDYGSDGTLVATWNDLAGQGLEVTETTMVFDNERPSGGFWSILQVRNTGLSTREFTAFHYLDLNLAGTASGDSGVLVAPWFLKFSEGDRTAFYRAHAPSHYAVASFPGVRDLLTDSALTTLGDSGLPFGPGDATAAFQFFTQTVAPSSRTTAGEVSAFFELTRDHVKGDRYGLLSYPSLFGQSQSGNPYNVAMRRTTQVWGETGPPIPAGRLIQGVDDFFDSQGDERVLRDPSTGVTYVEGVPLCAAPTLPLNWTLSATGDFNGDGEADIVWRNTTSQKIVVWTMNSFCKTGALIPTPDHAVDGNWEISAAVDFDGDGHRDLLWYNQTTGKLVIWYLDAALVRTTGVFTDPASVGNNNWRVVAVGDFGKGPAQTGTPVLDAQDVVWQNDTSLKIVVWFMNQAAQRTGGVFTTPDTLSGNYRVVGPR